MKKEKEIITAQDAIQNYLALKPNIIADLVGLLFMRVILMYLKLKQIICLAIQGLSIIVKNVEDIMVIFLMMDQSQLEKDTVIMAKF